MSVWLHAVGGGLQGLGTSMSIAAEERREMRGLAMREAYLRDRLTAEHKFRASEGEANRATRIEEANIYDATRRSEGEANRAARADEAAAERKQRDEHHADTIAQRDRLAAQGRAHELAILDRRLTATASQALEQANAEIERLKSQGYDLERMTDDARLMNELAPLFPKIDEDGDIVLGLDNKPTPDMQLIRAVLRVRENTGEWPRQHDAVTFDDIRATMAAQNRSFDDTIFWLERMGYHVPNSTIQTARGRLGIEEPARPGRRTGATVGR